MLPPESQTETDDELVVMDPEDDIAPVETATAGYAPETINLAEVLTEEERKKCAERVVKDFVRDKKSCKKHFDRVASILKLYLGDMPPLPDGETIANAQVHYPLIAKAIGRIHARVYDQQFPSNGEFCGVHPTDAFDLDRAIRVAKHMNWQIAKKIPEYVNNHDALIMQWLLYGSAFSQFYWDPVKKRPCHEVCATEDIVLSYKRKSTDPSLGDVPRISRVLRKYRHELEDLQDGGYYAFIDKLFEDEDEEGETTAAQSEDNEENDVVQEVIDRDAGVEKGEDDPDAPRVLIEQHCWYKLPGEKRQRPVVITVDLQKRLLLCLKLREDEDPLDRARFNRESEVADLMYKAAIIKYELDLAAYYQNQTQPPLPGMTDATMPPVPGAMDSTMLGPPPEMPQPPPPPEPPRMVPINFFTHYVCIPNPEGVYGFGIGSLLEGHNMAADTLASQLVDAATLANTSGGFISRQMKVDRGEIRFQPGEFVQVDTMGADLSKLILPIKFAPPEPAMGQLIKDQEAAADDLSSAGDILSGEVGGSNETATTTQIRMSAAMTMIAIWGKRYTRCRTCELQKLARLNSVHLEDAEYFAVVDPYKQIPPQGGGAPPSAAPGSPPAGNAPPAVGAPPPVPLPGDPMQPAPVAPPMPDMTQLLGPAQPSVETMSVTRMDYLEDVDIQITADPRMSSQPQRIAEAMQIMNVINNSPFLAAMPALQIAGAREFFVALDNPRMTAALGMALQMPAMPPPGAPPPGGPPPDEGGPPQPDDPGPTADGAGPQPANGNMTT